MKMPNVTPKTAQHFRRDGSAKKSFPSEEHALTAAEQTHMQAYQCGLCGKWHIGGEA